MGVPTKCGAQNFTRCLYALFLIALAACSYDPESLIPKEEARFAKEFLQKLRERDYQFVRRHLRSDVEKTISRQELDELVSYFPDGPLLSTELIGSNVLVVVDESWRGNFTYEYEFKQGWVLASVVLVRADDGIEAIGIRVHRMEQSRKAAHAFTLRGKSLLHLLFLFLVVAVPLFILVTFVFCIRTPFRRRKWLWLLFILLGFGSLSLNWSTGELVVQPLKIQLLGAGVFSAGPHAPWFLSIGVPLGAMVFWFRRKRFVSENKHGQRQEVDEDPNC